MVFRPYPNKPSHGVMIRNVFHLWSRCGRMAELKTKLNHINVVCSRCSNDTEKFRCLEYIFRNENLFSSLFFCNLINSSLKKFHFNKFYGNKKKNLEKNTPFTLSKGFVICNSNFLFYSIFGNWYGWVFNKMNEILICLMLSMGIEKGDNHSKSIVIIP